MRRMTREIANEDGAFAGVVDGLSQRFPEIARSDVQGVVELERHVFDDARLQDFVPVFVERASVEIFSSQLSV
jgi:hypothetical protein